MYSYLRIGVRNQDSLAISPLSSVGAASDGKELKWLVQRDPHGKDRRSNSRPNILAPSMGTKKWSWGHYIISRMVCPYHRAPPSQNYETRKKSPMHPQGSWRRWELEKDNRVLTANDRELRHLVNNLSSQRSSYRAASLCTHAPSMGPWQACHLVNCPTSKRWPLTLASHTAGALNLPWKHDLPFSPKYSNHIAQ